MKKLEKGFTLIELMIVVAIIGILAAVGAPRFGDQIKRAKDGKALATIQTWRGAANLYYADKLNEVEKFKELLIYVDDKTKNSTSISTTTMSAISDTNSDITVAYVEAGTGNKTNKIGNSDSVKFIITSGAISIDEENTVVNTAKAPWNTL